MTSCRAMIKATVFVTAIFGGIQFSSGSRVGTCVAGSDEILRQTRRPLGDQGAGGFFWSFPLVEELTGLFGGFGRSEISLPQDPKANVEARREQLAERQERYRWSTEGLPTGIPFLEGFPPQEELPSLSWFMKLGTNMASSIIGAARGRVGIGEIVSEMMEALTSREKALAFGGKMRDLIQNDRVNERPAGIEGYADLHASPMKTPDSVHDYEQDDAFARQRLQGGNCAVIEKCSSATRQKLKVLDYDPTYADLRQKVDSLMAEGKLFVVDHDLLKGMEASPLDGEIPRYLAPGIALFEVVDDDLLPIKPIGIQLSQGEEATPIFTPEDGYNWMIAKAHFESADFIIHEVVSHLGNTHLLLEGPLVALHRQLPVQHPIYALMNPHLEGTALINWGAQEMLIVEGGGVDRLQGNKIEDTWRLVLETTLERMSNDFSPEADFEARRVTMKDFPGRYPYRDFGLRFWDATYTWVKEYLDIYYTRESDINADYELGAFIEELIEIGQVGWLKDFQMSRDKKSFLTKVIASYIYTASTLHAAVNFPQRSLMSFAPNTPGAMYAPPPLDKSTRTFEDYLDCLPPMEMATSQAVLGNLLGSVFHTRLGDYERGHFVDKRVQGPLTNFQRTLNAIEADIVDENDHVVEEWSKRGKDKRDAANFAYNTLLPDCIPQSINI